MPRLLSALLAAAALIAAAAPAAAQAHDHLPRAHPVPLVTEGPPRLAHYGVERHVPAEVRAWSRGVGRVRGADHWGDEPVAETRFEDQHGHILTFATDNPEVDVTPWANLIASTYHGPEIELAHVFVTSSQRLSAICGEDAAACYAADGDDRPRNGVMIVSYEDDAQLATHAMIHEYGHHIDNNTYNLGSMSSCRIDGDGSRRWFFARQTQDDILDKLSCNAEAGWGQLLPEVFAEDYAQLVGLPREEYHPAIQVPPPTTAIKRALKADLDRPFSPASRKVSGRSSRSRTATFRLRLPVPVFVALRGAKGVRSASLRGCSVRGVKDVYAGSCRLVIKTKRARQRFSFRLAAY